MVLGEDTSTYNRARTFGSSAPGGGDERFTAGAIVPSSGGHLSSSGGDGTAPLLKTVTGPAGIMEALHRYISCFRRRARLAVEWRQTATTPLRSRQCNNRDPDRCTGNATNDFASVRSSVHIYGDTATMSSKALVCDLPPQGRSGIDIDRLYWQPGAVGSPATAATTCHHVCTPNTAPIKWLERRRQHYP